MKVTKLVIDRATWGTDHLLNCHDSSMCCLGFLALKCGANPDEIEDATDPADVPNVDWPPAFIRIGRDAKGKEVISITSLTNSAININDSGTLKFETKEKRLIALFKKAGIKLSFTGRRTPGRTV